MEENRFKLENLGINDPNRIICKCILPDKNKFDANDKEYMYKKLGEIVLAQICTDNKNVVQALLTDPSCRNNFLNETVKAIKKTQTGQVIEILSQNIYNEEKERLDILSIAEKSIRNKSLKNEVITSIAKSQKVDLSKIKNKDMDKSANKEATNKKK